MFTYMWNWLLGLPATVKYILVGAVVIFVLLWVNYTSRQEKKELKATIALLQQNLLAAADSVRAYQLADGTMNTQKYAFVVKKLEDLQTLNKDLYEEVKLQKANIKAISKAQVVVVHDSVKTHTILDKSSDSTWFTVSTFDTTYSPGNYRKLRYRGDFNFNTQTATSTIEQDEIGFTAVTGIKETDGKYEIFVNPKYPNMGVIGLEGAILDPQLFAKKQKAKTKLITLGANIGWVPTTYDFNTKQFDFKPTRVGASVGLNINLKL